MSNDLVGGDRIVAEPTTLAGSVVTVRTRYDTGWRAGQFEGVASLRDLGNQASFLRSQPCYMSSILGSEIGEVLPENEHHDVMVCVPAAGLLLPFGRIFTLSLATHYMPTPAPLLGLESVDKDRPLLWRGPGSVVPGPGYYR